MAANIQDGVVARIFSGTAAAYDEIVDVATRGVDRRWKEDLLAHIAAPRRVLDLACGTGILTFMIRERFPEAEVVGVDVTQSLLEVARERARERGDARVAFLLSAAEEVDVPGPFDAITSCYLPKYADLPRLVPRLVDRMAPGGILAMQDFVYPDDRGVRIVWEGHFTRMRQWAEQDRPEAVPMFDELPSVIRESRWTEDLESLLKACGLAVTESRQSWGTSAIVVGRKPS
ncbi:MAG TPA: class I SAM-dependent methyltransferase [Thermoanaerobaculia bacterium]|nr:class I SAM-dependent methyltransferase [Thermoanaerobaculia bacterium]